MTAENPTSDVESAAPKVSRGTVSAIMAEITEQLETVARPDWTVPEVRSVAIYIGTLVDDLLEELDPAQRVYGPPFPMSPPHCAPPAEDRPDDEQTGGT